MKKQIKVIRGANKTIVIYSDRKEVRMPTAPVVARQKPVPVRYMGQRIAHIMPSGRVYPVRVGTFWRIVKFLRPRAAFVV